MDGQEEAAKTTVAVTSNHLRSPVLPGNILDSRIFSWVEIDIGPPTMNKSMRDELAECQLPNWLKDEYFNWIGKKGTNAKSYRASNAKINVKKARVCWLSLVRKPLPDWELRMRSQGQLESTKRLQKRGCNGGRRSGLIKISRARSVFICCRKIWMLFASILSLNPKYWHYWKRILRISI